MEDEYWNDPELYELAVELDTFKQKLIDSAKDEIKSRIKKLETENGEMKARLKDLDKLEEEAKTAKRNAEYAASNAERSVRFRKAKELFREVAEEKYLVTYRHYYKDLCGKCDNRKIKFTSPSGKQCEELCESCGYQQTEKVVTEAIGNSVDIRNGEIMIWYYPRRGWEDDEYNDMSSSVKVKYTGQPYEDLNEYDTLFNSREDAQKFADYLNEKKTK